MANTLAELVVKLRADARPLAKGLARSQASVRDLQKSILNVRSAFAVVAGSAGVGVLAKSILDIGAAAEETRSKFKTVFGQASRDVDAFVDSFGLMAGLSRTAARDLTATVGAIGQGMGIAREESGEFAKSLVRLAGDIASFNNRETAAVSRAITSALTGEREAIKQFGIVVSEADVQTRALATSGKAAASALTQQEKAYATMALIAERAGVAVGDLARTQDSAANEARKLGARFNNVRDSLSRGMLPAIETALPLLDQLAERMETSARESTGWFRSLRDAMGIANQISDIELEGIRANNFRTADEVLVRLRQERDAYQQLQQEMVGLERRLQRPAIADLGIGALVSDLPQTRAAIEDLSKELAASADVMSYLNDEFVRLSREGAPAAEAAVRQVATGTDRSVGQDVAAALKRIREELALSANEYRVFGDANAYVRAQVDTMRDGVRDLLAAGLAPTSKEIERLTTRIRIMGGETLSYNEQLRRAKEATLELALATGAAFRSVNGRARVGIGEVFAKDLTDIQRAGQQVFNNLTLNIGRAIDDWKDALRSFKDFFIQTFAQLAARAALLRAVQGLATLGGPLGQFGGFLLSAVTDDIPNVNPALAGAGASFDFSRFPAARNTLEASRDREWQAFLSGSIRNGSTNGYRYL